MDHRQLVRILSAGRVVVGASLVIAPGLIGRSWVGEDGSSTGTKLAFRTMGIRDLALGAGTLHALATGEPARSWVLLSAISDAVDATATLIAFRRLPLRASLPALVTASTAAAVGASAVDRLD